MNTINVFKLLDSAGQGVWLKAGRILVHSPNVVIIRHVGIISVFTVNCCRYKSSLFVVFYEVLVSMCFCFDLIYDN